MTPRYPRRKTVVHHLQKLSERTRKIEIARAYDPVKDGGGGHPYRFISAIGPGQVINGDGSVHKVNFQAPFFDPESGWDAGTNRYTPPVGTYFLAAYVGLNTEPPSGAASDSPVAVMLNLRRTNNDSTGTDAGIITQYFPEWASGPVGPLPEKIVSTTGYGYTDGTDSKGWIVQLGPELGINVEITRGQFWGWQISNDNLFV